MVSAGKGVGKIWSHFALIIRQKCDLALVEKEKVGFWLLLPYAGPDYRSGGNISNTVKSTQ